MTQFIIEVFTGRNSKKATRYSFSNKKKVTIGRSYGCDVIIDDPYVSAEHLKVFKQDGLQVEDLNSENGTLFGKKKIKNEDISIKSGDEIHIGHTRIRVFTHDHSIKPTKLVNWANHLRGFLTRPTAAITIFLLTCFIGTFYQWLVFTDLNYFEESIFEDLLGIVVAIIGISLVIHGVFSKTKHKIKFTAALSYTSLILVTTTVFGLLPDISLACSLNYYLTESINWGLQAFILASFVLLIANLENGRIILRDYALAALIMIIIPFIVFYKHISPDEDMKLEPLYEKSVPVFAWEPEEAISIETFLANNESVFETED